MSEAADSRYLQLAVERLLRQHIEETREAVIKAAVEDFEKQLRRRVATAAMEVASYYEMSTMREGLTITVKRV